MEQDNSSIFNFKLYLFRVFLPFLAGVILLSYIFTYFFEKKVILGSPLSGAYKINRIINETYPSEIPIFGSSRAKACYVPSILGANYFDYGLDGTRDDVMLMMMRAECKKKKGSKMIISNFDMEGRYPLTGDIANYIYNANYKPVKELMGKSYKTQYGIPIIKYFGLFEAYTGFYLSDKIQFTKRADHGGQYLKTAIPAEEFNKDVEKRNASITTFHNDPKLTKGFSDLIEANPDRLFVFVVAPYHKSFFNHYNNLDSARNYLNSLRKIKNVKVLDFSSLSYSYPDSLFANTTHLNYKGAVRFSKTLKDSLSTIVQ